MESQVVFFNLKVGFAVKNRYWVFTFLFRFRSRTRTTFLEKNTYPLRFRTTILKKTRSTFRSRTLILKMNPYPLRTRTYNLQTNPFPLRLRFRTWVRERNGYGIITRTPDSGTNHEKSVSRQVKTRSDTYAITASNWKLLPNIST